MICELLGPFPTPKAFHPRQYATGRSVIPTRPVLCSHGVHVRCLGTVRKERPATRKHRKRMEKYITIYPPTPADARGARQGITYNLYSVHFGKSYQKTSKNSSDSSDSPAFAAWLAPMSIWGTKERKKKPEKMQRYTKVITKEKENGGKFRTLKWWYCTL